jgi:predicted lipoprotein with Yx(FWY)xxD motif
MGIRRRTWIRGGQTAGAALAGALLLAACSSGSSGGSSGAGPYAPTPSAAASPVTAAVTVTARSGPLGTYLTDAKGDTLYLFDADSAGRSACNAACLAAWPALTTTGAVQAGTGVMASDLSTITASDGTKQVAYDGHPLYFFVKDTKAGDTAGEGVDAFGAPWWLVAPDGSALMKTAAPSSAASTGSGSAWG